MSNKVLALKDATTQPPGEGYLAAIANVHPVRSYKDLDIISVAKPDVVICDVHLPGVKGDDLLRKLKDSLHRFTLVFVDFHSSPRQIKEQLANLQVVQPKALPRMSVSRIMKVLGVSQEMLARMLNVSSRTVHRWVKGSRPRRKPELDKLSRVALMLEQTLDTPDAIQGYLHHANPNFNGEEPLSLLFRGDFAKVEGDLLAIQEGAYV
jgi:DNA-binding transcriptional regulator YiaG